MLRSAAAPQGLAIATLLCLGLGTALAQDKAPAPDPASAPDPESAEPAPVPAPVPAPESAPIAEPEARPQTVPSGLVEARAAINDAQYEAALASLQSALSEGVSQPQTLEEIYRLQGETLVAIGKASEANASFQALLALNPSATLGEFASPKIVEVLEKARTDLAGSRLEASHSMVDGTRRLEITVASDPVGMVAKVQLSYPREDESVAELSIPLEGGKALFDVPVQADSALVLALLDRFGNVVLRWDVDSLPALVAPIAVSKGGQLATNPGEAPLWAKWWLWAGATGAAATVGTVFGIASSSAQSDLDDVMANPGDHFTSEARRLEDKAKSRAMVANISFVVAAALGVTSGVMYWRARNSETSLQVVPATEGAGASLVMGGSF